jgi:hypothetical protein
MRKKKYLINMTISLTADWSSKVQCSGMVSPLNRRYGNIHIPEDFS